MWSNLVGSGWVHWNSECLNALKQESDKNKEIVYIAGGSDIYQMIKHGIYNIRVIDPFFPAQDIYNVDGHNWLITGDIGDTIKFDFSNKEIVMKRTGYKKLKENLIFALPGKNSVHVPKSETTWKLYENNKFLGTVTFERRCTNQKDFDLQPNKIGYVPKGREDAGKAPFSICYTGHRHLDSPRRTLF